MRLTLSFRTLSSLECLRFGAVLRNMVSGSAAKCRPGAAQHNQALLWAVVRSEESLLLVPSWGLPRVRCRLLL